MGVFLIVPQCNASLQIEEGKAQLLQAPETQSVQTDDTPPSPSSTPRTTNFSPESAIENPEPLRTSAENTPSPDPLLNPTAETDKPSGISADNDVSPAFESTAEPEMEQSPTAVETQNPLLQKMLSRPLTLKTTF